MARQERAEQTRNAILEAAAVKFDEVGFLGASLSDILAEAGVTKGALYFHFPSKEDLALAIIEEQFLVLDELTASGELGLQMVIDLSQNMGASLRSDARVRAAIRLSIEQGSFQGALSAAAAKTYQRWNDVVQDCLVAAKAAGDLKKEVNPSDLAVLIVSSFTGIQLSSQVLTGRADLTERLTYLWATVIEASVPPRRIHKFNPAGSEDIRMAAAV